MILYWSKNIYINQSKQSPQIKSMQFVNFYLTLQHEAHETEPDVLARSAASNVKGCPMLSS